MYIAEYSKVDDIVTVSRVVSKPVEIEIQPATRAGEKDSAEMIFIDDYAGNDTEGRFVMEAENYSSRILGTNSGWWEVNGSTNRFAEGPSSAETAPTDESGAP